MAKSKRCTGCQRKLPSSQFRRKGDRLTSRCKQCLGEIARRDYDENPRRRKQVAAAVGRRQRKLQDYVRSLKVGRCCADCNTPYPYYVLDFDHRDGEEKGVELAKVGRLGWSTARIDREVAKCDLVCANCHRERTHQRRVQDRRKLSMEEHPPDKRKVAGSIPARRTAVADSV